MEVFMVMVMVIGMVMIWLLKGGGGFNILIVMVKLWRFIHPANVANHKNI